MRGRESIGDEAPRRSGSSRGGKLARLAVGLLTLVVCCQSVFLLYLMRSMPAHHASSKVTAEGSSATDGALRAPVAPAEQTPRKQVHAAWLEIAQFLERPVTTGEGASLLSTLPTGMPVAHPVREREPVTAAVAPKQHASVESTAPYVKPSPTGESFPSVQQSAADTTPVRVSPSSSPPPHPTRIATLEEAPHHNAERPRRAASRQPSLLRTEAPKSTKLVHILGDVHVRAPPQDADTVRMLSVAAEPPVRIRHLKDAAVVVLCFDRPQLLETAVGALTAARLSSELHRYISQDGGDAEVRRVAEAAAATGYTYLQHPRTLPPVLTGSVGDDGLPKPTPSTMYLAAHYKWVLDELFLQRGHSHVIVLEDDMRVSADVFEMFETLAPLLDADPTLWCISSWNDNGFRYFDVPADRFFRSSYFPGLGWMLKKALWLELSPLFPDDNWDHWMRATTTSKHRECISPWRSRNYNLGVGGATSNEEFYSRYLEPIMLHDGHPVRYGSLSYLLNGPYFAAMQKRIAAVPSHRWVDGATVTSAEMFEPNQPYVVHYTHETYELLAQTLNIHPSPRSSYRRSIWLRTPNRAEIFLVDRRLSPFCPTSLRRRPHAALVIEAATEAGASCVAVCQLRSLQCARDQFDFINDCEVLKDHFSCPNGCTQGWGDDIPNTETSGGAQSWGTAHKPQCLVTEVFPTCEASFPFTKRLCPCIPVNDRGG